MAGPAAPLRASWLMNRAHVDAELDAEHAAMQPGHAITIGLRMKMAEDWQAHWKTPVSRAKPQACG